MTTLKGVFPDPKPARKKNFIHENVKNLRRMEQCFHTNKEVEQMQKLQLSKHQRTVDRYQNVSARIGTSHRGKKEDNAVVEPNSKEKTQYEEQQLCRKTSAPVLEKKCITLTKKPFQPSAGNNTSSRQRRGERKRGNKNSYELQSQILSDPNLRQNTNTDDHLKSEAHIMYKNQGIQTMDTNQIDELYAQGVIRYPSKKNSVCDEKENNDSAKVRDKNLHETPSPPSDRGDRNVPETIKKELELNTSESPPSKDEIDVIKINKERTTVANKMATRLNNGVPPTNYRKGIVPKYIRERKEAHEKELKAKAEAYHPDCPEGHIPLPDNERKETLRMLKKNYQDYVNELNMMPIRTDTLRAQRRKMEIEKQLSKLEEGIKVFSRPKVYVKINA
ncbi:hypothetical protein KM043_015391 [Ampulex compressa]|nr:hypothetical protein KM043_015391 [Ampulex compressa]